MTFFESVVEQAALAWLESVGWQVRNGAEIAPGEPAAERDDYGQVVLAQRLRDALARQVRLRVRLPRSYSRAGQHDEARAYASPLRSQFVLCRSFGSPHLLTAMNVWTDPAGVTVVGST